MRIASSVPMQSEVAIENEIVAYAGLDWADQQHVICWQAAGSAQVQTAVVQQRPEELQAWVAELRQRFPQGLVAIALEQSRGAVIAALMHFDFLRLYPINPKSLARYREAFASSGAKDDPDDAGAAGQTPGSVDALGARRSLKPGAGPAGGASAATGESADQADPATAQPFESLFPPSPGLGRGARQPASL